MTPDRLSLPSDAAPRPARISMTLLMWVGLSGLLAWVGCFEIDQTVRAQGPVIQAPDGGVLLRILVPEGQEIHVGQDNAMLEREWPDAAFEDSRAWDAVVAAALLRAQAEAAETAPVFGSRFNEYPHLVAAQQALFWQHRLGLREELSTLLDRQDMARLELEMNESMLKSGDASRLEVMRARRQVGKLQGEVSVLINKYL